MSNNSFSGHRAPVSLLVFTLLFPLAQAVLYFIVMADADPLYQKAAYMLTKGAMLVLPFFYMAIIAKAPWRVRPFSTRGLLEGSLFGIGGVVLGLLVYFFFLKPAGLLGEGTAPAIAITRKMEAFGLTGIVPFIVFAAFLSFMHSGLEEYYWRWFAFGELKKIMSTTSAIIICGFGFMLHHVVILGVFFGFERPETWLFSLAIALGGMYWCWLYERKDSIYAPWLSHGFIDLGIFIIAYDMLYR